MRKYTALVADSEQRLKEFGRVYKKKESKFRVIERKSKLIKCTRT